MSLFSKLAIEVAGNYSFRLPIDIYKIVTDYGISIDHILTGVELDGMYMPFPVPSIAINDNCSPEAQRYTLAHYLYKHLICIRKVRSCSCSEYGDPFSERQEERNFVTNLLMPKTALISKVQEGLNREELLKTFLVSEEHLDNRLEELGIKVTN